MLKILYTILIISIPIFSFNYKSEPKNKVILAIFAHPDDETAIAQLLAKYSKDNKVYVIIATDGRFGTRRGFPTGDSLAALRQTESECAAKILGVQPPVFLGFTDGFDTRIGLAAYFKQSKKLKEMLRKKIEELQPGVIITFGPDGDTGHSDHRMVSNITTEIILKEGWVERFPLYYLGWIKKDDEKFKMIGGLNTVNPDYLNISIGFSDTDEEKAMQSIKCYKSQLSEEEINEWIATEKKDSSNTFYFRQLTVSGKRRTDF
ncbi:MAG: PIG-L family deacetylase [Ferruginibacter sp.]